MKNAKKLYQPNSIIAIQCIRPFYAFLMPLGRIFGLLGLVIISVFFMFFRGFFMFFNMVVGVVETVEGRMFKA